MKPLYLFLILFPFSVLCFAQDAPYGGLNVEKVSFKSHDNINVYADLFITDKKNATIVLFHQAKSNARGEYESILPRLAEKGFNIMAVDQRSGGDLYGADNRTASAIDKVYGYCEAYPDFEASIDYLTKNGFGRNMIVWGSSYSAALVIQLAAKREEISGVIAFSPASGEPMGDCQPDVYLKKIQKPVLVMRPPKEAVIPRVKQQLDLAVEYGHEIFVAKEGMHGSSMLVGKRFNGDAEPTWKRVMIFLSQFDQERIDKETAKEVNAQLWKPFKASFETRDWETFNQLHTDDVLRVNRYGIRLGDEYKSAVRSSYQRADSRKRQIDFCFEHRLYKGDTGYEVGYYRLIYTDEGKEPSVVYRRFHVMLKKREGKWLIAQDWDTGEINGIKISAEDFNKKKMLELD